ncbi:MAG: amino acid adenylation domain-containing protein, partial [Holophagales bacterium]|nr:amino acid adenylation domain-containing protein [Holophagales bacterium]
MDTAPRLGHSQRQIAIGQQLHPSSPLYNMGFAFVVAGELDPEAFRRAWGRVAGASPVLRTRVEILSGGTLRPRPAGPAPDPPPTTVLDFRDHADPRAHFLRWARERCGQPLRIDGELVESALVRLGSGHTGWYLNQHHLITDAWSSRLLYGRVAAAYAEELEGGSSSATAGPVDEVAAPAGPPAAVPQAAREHWQGRRERGGRRVSLYGRRASASPVSSKTGGSDSDTSADATSADGISPTGASADGASDPGASDTASTRLTLELDADRSRALDALAREPEFRTLSGELSRFAVFAMLFSTFLHRASGQTEVGFDAPVAGRPTRAAKGSLGVFIELFPFAARVEPGDTFRSVGERCLGEAMAFLRHALPGLGSSSGAEAGNAVLNYIPEAFGPFAGAPVEVEWLHPGHGDSVHALRLQVHDFAGSGRYRLHFDVREAALPERLRRRIPEHFEALLDACLEDPDRPIGSIDVRTEEERRSWARLQATDAHPLPECTVVDRFLEQAGEHPERVALRSAGQAITFGRLREQVEGLAASWAGEGLIPGERVAVYGHRSIPTVAAILALLRARAAFVPLDPSWPAARREQVLRDAGARWLLVDGEVGGDGEAGAQAGPAAPEALPSSLEVRPIPRGATAALPRAALPRPELPRPRLDGLAYLLYTSGSTGRPKGVPVEHAGLADYLEWASRRYVRGEPLTYALFTPLSFDLTLTSLFLPLVTGGTLEIYPRTGGSVDAALLDVVRDNAVDFLKLTPSHLSLLRRLGLEGSRLRRMVVGGENLEAPLAAAVSTQLSDRVEIHNEYGPTEAVVGCIAHRFDPAEDRQGSVPIGAPADHVRIEVLGPEGAPVPEGVPGELWISRHGLARGYHGQPELTAERFPPHPERSGERRYRTGDLVRQVAPGSLEYLGRLDRQVKVSGLRVELGEVEAALASAPGVARCAVVPRRQKPADPRAVSLGGHEDVVRHCVRCGLPSSYPRASLDAEGVCSLCLSYEAIREHARAYFRTLDDLRALFEASRREHDPPYDALVLVSGGKDSTYALCRLVEMGLRLYAFTLDNGYISDGAKANIRRVAARLGVETEFATTPAMAAIFRDSLARFSNVCNGCFKTIYTLALKRAHEMGIPIIVTGLSRGQMFETRLTPEMFRDGRVDPEEVDAAVLAARKAYHRTADEVSRSLDVSLFREDEIF